MKILRLIVVTLMVIMLFVACRQTKVVIQATELPSSLTATPRYIQTESVPTFPPPTLTAEPTAFYPVDRVWADYDEGVPFGIDEYAIIDINEQFKPQFYGRKIEDWEAYGSPATIADFRSGDPVELGLYLQGFPNLDDLQPEVIHVYKISENEISVVTLDLNRGDDSILDIEKRTDLMFSSDMWQVTWMGYRQRCRRNHSDDWVKGRCP